jgi:hypothetical protein
MRTGSVHAVHGRLVLVLAAALLAVPAAARAQGGGPEQFRLGPLEWLLEGREALGLTPAQIARLEEVKRRHEARNAPLVDRLMTLRAAWQQERLAMRRAGAREESQRLQQLRARSEPLFHQIQRNNQTAMTAVNQLLTGQQRRLLRELVQERRGRPGPGTPPARPDGWPGGGG